MNCNCQVTELIIGIVILIFAFWQMTYSQWIIAIAAAVLIVHSFTCKMCRVDHMKDMASKKKRR